MPFPVLAAILCTSSSATISKRGEPNGMQWSLCDRFR